METDRDALLRGVLDAPLDDAPRLIFADWLDEHGEGELAALLRGPEGPAWVTGQCFTRAWAGVRNSITADTLRQVADILRSCGQNTRETVNGLREACRILQQSH